MIDGVGILGMALENLRKFLDRPLIIHVVEIIERRRVEWIGGAERQLCQRLLGNQCASESKGDEDSTAKVPAGMRGAKQWGRLFTAVYPRIVAFVQIQDCTRIFALCA